MIRKNMNNALFITGDPIIKELQQNLIGHNKK